MKFSVSLPNVTHYPPLYRPWYDDLTNADLQEFVRVVESLNFDVIQVQDHIITPRSHLEAMGSYWSHGLTAMGFVAGASQRVRIRSAVIVVPYHNVIELAKMLSTLDRMSGGRVDFAFGIGHSEHEFEALGVPFKDRGRRTDEYIEAMQVLWSEDEPEFKGQFVEFHDVFFDPKPVQRPRIPILAGGNSRASLRRAAKLDGWFPWLIGADDLPGCLDYLREQPEFDPGRPFELVMPVSNVQVAEEDHRPLANTGLGRPEEKSVQQIIDQIGKLEALGVTTTSTPIPHTKSLEEHLDHLRHVSEEIIPLFRSS
jgi:probable F420-dependent oxidoreductase